MCHQDGVLAVDKCHHRSGPPVDKCQQTNRRAGWYHDIQRDFYSNLLRPVTLIRGVYSENTVSTRYTGIYAYFFAPIWGVFGEIWTTFGRFLPANGRISARSSAGLGGESVPVTASIRPTAAAFPAAPEAKTGTLTAAAASERYPSHPQAVCLRAAFAGGSQGRFGCTEFVRVCTVFVRFLYGFARKSADLCAWKAGKRRSQASRTGR